MMKNNMKSYESGGDSKFSRRAISGQPKRYGEKSKTLKPIRDVDADADNYHFRTNLKQVNIGKIRVLDRSVFNLP